MARFLSWTDLKPKEGIMRVINQIVDRQHFSDSHRRVIAHVISCLVEGYATFKAMPRVERRELMAAAIKRHTANRNLYRQTILGRVGF